ncbi:unnamed protein product [Leuciscus chuanchicus]
MKGLVCLLLLLETFVCVVQHQVDGGLNENEISQQLRSEDGRQNPPQTDTLRDGASTDSQQNYHLFFTDIHAALRELTATVTEQKANIRELTATVTEQKTINRELTATVTEQKVNIRELTTTVTEQKVNIRELTATVTEQKTINRELTATVTEQKVNIRELTATVTEQKTNIRELTATVTEQKTNIRELTATVTEQKANIRELTATVTEQKVNIRELTATVTEQKTINRELTANIRALETRLREEMNKKNDEMSNLTLSQVEELRKENRDREIAFSASLMQSSSGHIGPFTSDFTLNYRNVFTNIGNAYNPVTGVFTAPLKGAYMFRVSVFSHGPTPSAASIYKNGERLVMAYAHQPQRELNSSNGVVLILEVGDVVYTKKNTSKKGKYEKRGKYLVGLEDKPGHRIPKAGVLAEAGVGRAAAELSILEVEAKGPKASAGAEASSSGAGVMARAEVGSVSAKAGLVFAKLGLGVDMGASFGLGGLEAKFLGTGISIGPKTSVSLLGSEVSCSGM